MRSLQIQWHFIHNLRFGKFVFKNSHNPLRWHHLYFLWDHPFKGSWRKTLTEDLLAGCVASKVPSFDASLGGGFKYFFKFSSLFVEMIQFDYIFQMGWFNHQLVHFGLQECCFICWEATVETHGMSTHCPMKWLNPQSAWATYIIINKKCRSSVFVICYRHRYIDYKTIIIDFTNVTHQQHYPYLNMAVMIHYDCRQGHLHYKCQRRHFDGHHYSVPSQSPSFSSLYVLYVYP